MKHPYSNLITQFARMVEAGHPIEQLVQMRHPNGEWSRVDRPTWSASHEYRVALAFVEGRPVFEGDVLWHDGLMCKAKDAHTQWLVVDCGPDVQMLNPASLTWNPPAAPKFKRNDRVNVKCWITKGGAPFERLLPGIIQSYDGFGNYNVLCHIDECEYLEFGTKESEITVAQSTQTLFADHEERIARLERLVHP